MAGFMNKELETLRDNLLCGHCKCTFSGSDSQDRKSTRLNSSHRCISYAVFCLKKKKKKLKKKKKKLKKKKEQVQ